MTTQRIMLIVATIMENFQNEFVIYDYSIYSPPNSYCLSFWLWWN